MPHLYFSRESDDRKETLFAELPASYVVEYSPAGESGSSSSTAIPHQGQTCCETFFSNYKNLPDKLRLCLEYCSIVSMNHEIQRGKLVRLLLAEGLITETTGELMEDVAEQVIDQLLQLGMLHESYYTDLLRVPAIYQDLCLLEVDEKDFFSKALTSSIPMRVVIEDYSDKNPPDFRNLEIISLFVTISDLRGLSSAAVQALSQAYLESVCGIHSLLVLDFEGRIENLPDKVGDLVLLRYLELHCLYLKKLPGTLQNLQKLQTLDIRISNLRVIPEEVLNLGRLRHLLTDSSRVPKGIAKMVNIQICHGVSAACEISELGKLTQLRQLDIKDVSEDNSTELFSAIRMMGNLVSLSLTTDSKSFLPDMEEFSPPCLLKKVHLSGRLLEFPNWIASLENLTSLQFSFSNLKEYPTSVLQFLPTLKHLTLWQACEAKCIYEEFCQAGGFPNLETLTINSLSLIEWTEMVPGAFPRLRCLRFWNCSKLRFLPDGLQNIVSLQKLIFFATHQDLIRRLKGEENYKIKHIPRVIMF